MLRTKLLTRCCLIALLPLGAALPWQDLVAQADPTDTATRRAARFLAARHGIAAESLALAYAVEASDPSTGRRASILKMLDRRTGRVHAVVVDATGAASLRERAVRWQQARRAGRRALDAALEERSRTAGSLESLPVILWLDEPATAHASRPPARASRNAFDSAEKIARFASEVDAARSATLAPLIEPVAARLRLRGRTPAPHPFSPALAVSLTAAEIADVATWPGIDRIYLDEIAQPELTIARASLKASIVNNRGRNGTGIRIAMIEVGGRIATNAYLELTQDTTSVCASPSTHSTGVAGLINSNHPSRRGVAAGALLWAGGSCSGLSSQLQNRSTAAGDWGARTLNLSWGASATVVPGANDRFYDDMVLNRHIFVVKSSGNRAGPCLGDARLTSPALAYNVLTVGGYDDRNTVDWNDDIMDDCSSYVDPSSTAGDREKPEAVAPSMNIESTTTDGGVGNIGSGTSWASGLTTGVTALLMQRDPTLQAWPESLKAILMATAVHNVEGDRRLSDKDGAGGLSVERADDVARRYRGDWDGISFTCDQAMLAPPLDITMTLEAGRRTRGVIVWDTDPAYELYESQPGADLDVVVLDPLGGTVTSSATLDNTYEIVDFIPTSTGTYTLRVTTSRCDLSPRHLGWAWWRAG